MSDSQNPCCASHLLDLSHEQTNHVYETWQYMSPRALGSEHASQFSTNQSIVAEFGRALCLQATKRLIFRKVCFKRLTKFQVKKKALTRIGCFFLTCICIMNFMCRMFSLCCCTCVKTKLSGVLIQTKAILWVINERFPETTPGKFISTSMFCRKLARLTCCCCLSCKFE